MPMRECVATHAETRNRRLLWGPMVKCSSGYFKPLQLVWCLFVKIHEGKVGSQVVNWYSPIHVHQYMYIITWPSGLVHWTQVLVLSECGFESRPGRPAVLVSLSKTLNRNCFILRMGCKAVGPVCCVMHVKEPRREREGACPGVSGFARWAPSRVDMYALQNLLYYYHQ